MMELGTERICRASCSKIDLCGKGHTEHRSSEVENVSVVEGLMCAPDRLPHGE